MSFRQPTNVTMSWKDFKGTIEALGNFYVAFDTTDGTINIHDEQNTWILELGKKRRQKGVHRRKKGDRA